MARTFKTLVEPSRSDATVLRRLAATADPSIPPAVMPAAGVQTINRRLSSGLVGGSDTASAAAKPKDGTPRWWAA